MSVKQFFSYKIKLILILFLFALLTLFLVRTFSGPEDTWIKNKQGEWVKHGNPSTPMPLPDWKPPIVFTIAPILIFICYFTPFILKKLLKPNFTVNSLKSVSQLNFLWYLKTYLLVYIIGISICFLLVLFWGNK